MTATTPRQLDSYHSLRRQRSAAAVTAQYIREMSVRHRGPLHARPRRVTAPWAGCADRTEIDPIARPAI